MSLARNIGGEDLGEVTSIRKVGIAAFLGAMIFGHFGDRLGRKTILVLTLLVSVYLATETFRGEISDELSGEPGRVV